MRKPPIPLLLQKLIATFEHAVPHLPFAIANRLKLANKLLKKATRVSPKKIACFIEELPTTAEYAELKNLSSFTHELDQLKQQLPSYTVAAPTPFDKPSGFHPSTERSEEDLDEDKT